MVLKPTSCQSYLRYTNITRDLVKYISRGLEERDGNKKYKRGNKKMKNTEWSNHTGVDEKSLFLFFADRMSKSVSTGSSCLYFSVYTRLVDVLGLVESIHCGACWARSQPRVVRKQTSSSLVCPKSCLLEWEEVCVRGVNKAG